MRRQRRKPLHYTARCLYDGTVIAAYTVRKPLPKIIKRDRLRIDEDGVCIEWLGPGRELSDVNNETRTRFQDIIATKLNARRAIREMVLPELATIRQEIATLRSQLDRIELLLGNCQQD